MATSADGPGADLAPKELPVDIQLRTISPKAAAEMLEANAGNQRKRNDQRVAGYAKQMQAGKWNPVIGQPIMFTEDGTLINGQHRLAAVVKAGKSIQMLVAYGVAPETFWLLDQPEGVRTLSQKLSMSGVGRGGHVSAAALVAIAVRLSTRTGEPLDMRAIGVTEADRLQYIDENKGLISWVDVCHNLQGKTRTHGVPAGIVAGWAINAERALTNEADIAVLNEYVEKLYTMDMVPANGTVAHTRRSMQSYGSSDRADRAKKLAALNTGWRHFAAGNEVRRIMQAECTITFPARVTRAV